MPRKCCVPGCHSNYRGTPYVKNFHFPTNKEMRKSWIKRIPRKNFIPNKNSFVCENHFQESDVIYEDEFFVGSETVCYPRVSKLKANAVPSKFENMLSNLSVDHSHKKSNNRPSDMDSNVKQMTNTEDINIKEEPMDDSADSVISCGINEEKNDSSATDAENDNIKKEIIDDDSDSVISCDRNGEKEDSSSPESSESPCNSEPQMSNGPVLSLMCLHEDDDDEVEIIENDKSGVVDTTEIPELLIDISDEECSVDSGDLENEKTIGGDDVSELKKYLTMEVSEEINDGNDNDDMEEHPNLMTVKIESVSSDVSNTYFSRPSSSLLAKSITLPARGSFEGIHKFRIGIMCNSSTTSRKTENAVYYEAKNKLYVCKDHPFSLIVSAADVPAGSEIKVMAIFSSAELSNEIVQRCATHAQQDYIKGHSSYLHLVQSFSKAAIYKKEENGQLSVSVPYEKPQIGEENTSYLFKITCFSSCSGSINRRPFMLIFTLVNNNIPLGRQVLETKVCACPSRDYRVDLKKETGYTNRDSSLSTSSNQEKPILSEQTTSKFTITMTDPELYQFLKEMKAFYETSAYVKHLANMSQKSS